MATKKHCDVCDGLVDVKDTDDTIVKIDGPNNMLHEVRVKSEFVNRYNGEETPRKDLCRDCREKVFGALFEKYGGKIAVIR